MDTLQTPEFLYGEQALAWAVIEQAFKDAEMPRDCYDRQKARCFLCGYPKIWKGSLFFWCELSGINKNFIMYEARKRWKPELLKEKEDGRRTNPFSVNE